MKNPFKTCSWWLQRDSEVDSAGGSVGSEGWHGAMSSRDPLVVHFICLDLANDPPDHDKIPDSPTIRKNIFNQMKSDSTSETGR